MLFDVLEKDILRYPIEIESRVADIGVCYFMHLPADSVHRLIGQFLGDTAPSSGEDLDQPQSYLFVPLAGAIAIRVQPCKKTIER